MDFWISLLIIIVLAMLIVNWITGASRRRPMTTEEVKFDVARKRRNRDFFFFAVFMAIFIYAVSNVGQVWH